MYWLNLVILCRSFPGCPRLHPCFYSQLLANFQKKLSIVDNSDEYSNIVNEIINQGTELYDKVFEPKLEINDKTRSEIYTFIRKNDELLPLLNWLQYPDTFRNDFAATQERLGNKLLETTLNEDELKIAKKFIKEINSLKTLSSSLDKLKKGFKKRLEDCTSLDEIEDIESEIAVVDRAMNLVYDSLPFPTNEETAGAVIGYVETNPGAQEVMRRFNFRESLEGDILYNTARIVESMDSYPGIGKA